MAISQTPEIYTVAQKRRVCFPVWQSWSSFNMSPHAKRCSPISCINSEASEKSCPAAQNSSSWFPVIVQMCDLRLEYLFRIIYRHKTFPTNQGQPLTMHSNSWLLILAMYGFSSIWKLLRNTHYAFLLVVFLYKRILSSSFTAIYSDM